MEKKILVIGLVLGLMFGFFIGAVSSGGALADKDAKINRLSGQLSSSNAQVNQLSVEADKVPGLQQQVATLNSQVNSLNTQIQSLQGQLAAKSTEAANLQTTINDKTSLVTYLQGQVTDLHSQVTSLQAQVSASSKPAPQSNVTVLAVSFSRVDDTSALLQYWIGRANSTIRVAVMDFSYNALGDAITAAKNRGVNVEVYIDDGYVSSAGNEYPRLLAAGVQIRADTPLVLMHHKFIVIDGVIVGTGSFNWSSDAEKYNDENFIILRSPSVAQKYLREFNRMWASS